MAQTFFHHRKRILIAAAFGIDQVVRRQPRLRQPGGEQVSSARPQHLPILPRPAGGDGGDEESGGGIIAQAGAGARRFMKRPRGKSAAPQTAIHILDFKGAMILPPGPAKGFDRPHPGVKGVEANGRI